MQPFKAGMGSEEGLRRVRLVFVLSLATWVVARAAYSVWLFGITTGHFGAGMSIPRGVVVVNGINDPAFAVWVACLAWLAFLWLIDARQRSLEDRG
jgi:hypothetical protein